MDSYKEDWGKYRKKLESYGYSEVELLKVQEVRENYDLCPYEQFRELFLQGVIERVAKVKKPRNYFVNDSGEFLYLNHYHKAYCVAGKFKEE